MTSTQWRDERFAQGWAARDVLQDLLALPRRIAATVVAADRPRTAVVVDIGSGPGAFLACFLTALPEARGVWSDVSPAMEEIARQELAGFGDRVSYRIGDMAARSGLPSGVDVITTSRASHHLSVDALQAFYADAYARLAPGGWLVNLDHTYCVSPVWEARLRAARSVLVPPAPGREGHHHTSQPPTADQHVAALAAVGFTDVDMPWRAFPTCLFMARRDDDPTA